MTTLVYIPSNLPTEALQSRRLGRPHSAGTTTELPMVPPGGASVGPPAVDGASDAVLQLGLGVTGQKIVSQKIVRQKIVGN